MKPLLAIWNLCRPFKRETDPHRARWQRIHYQDRMRREMRARLRPLTPGRGNKAWKRLAALDNEPHTISWPAYAL